MAQDCNCNENYNWLKETFEKNDAGFQYAIDQKGQEKYKEHCEVYASKTKTINQKDSCAKALMNWLLFFRKGHIWIGVNQSQANAGNQWTPENPAAVKEQFKNWETYPYKEKEFSKFLSQLKEPSIEGVWASPPYKIGVKKVDNKYIGFIIEADGVYWTKSQVKFKLEEKNGKMTAVYHPLDHSTLELDNVELVGNNYLKIGPYFFNRDQPHFAGQKNIELSVRSLSSEGPFFESISASTNLLRIPSFSDSEKGVIDSIIAANEKLILQTENLIIDLRYNGGGSDISYQNLLPFLYTNPIREVGVKYLSTPLNNRRMEEFASSPDNSEEDNEWYKNTLERLNNNIGKFVGIGDTSISVSTLDTIYPFPKKIGIIINEGNASTTEQFLLAAKQSQKVKLFGTTTMGCLDISNMYFTDSPSGEFKLGYCLSKSNRIPEFMIDEKGIQPDYFLDSSISQYDWIDYVIQILEGH